ncbi:hypothetical protein SCALM49S_06434 [Streptomyces californicus]
MQKRAYECKDRVKEWRGVFPRPQEIAGAVEGACVSAVGSASILSVSKLTDVPKRILIGRALRSDKLGETLLPKRIALPVFASDPLSSVAYAPGEVLLVLSIAGVSAYHFTWIAVAVTFVLLFTVVRPSGRMYHAVRRAAAATTRSRPAGLGHGGRTDRRQRPARRLRPDRRRAISSGVENLGSVVQFVVEGKTLCAVGAVVLLALMNLRGVTESAKTLRRPHLSLRGRRLPDDAGAQCPRAGPRRLRMHATTAELQIRRRAPGAGRIRPRLPAPAASSRLRRPHRRRGGLATAYRPCRKPEARTLRPRWR